jgi:hypothetical protein
MSNEPEPTAELRAFICAVEKLCGEANEAARLSVGLFSEPHLKEVRRALAECMQLAELRVFSVVHVLYPGVHELLYPGHERHASDA